MDGVGEVGEVLPMYSQALLCAGKSTGMWLPW